MSMLYAADAAALVGDKNSVLTLSSNNSAATGSQNNTFIDSSVNNATITGAGTPTQGSFSPYGDTWSTKLDTCTLSIPATTSISVLSGDFTIEAWVNLTSSASCGLIDTRNSAATAASWVFSVLPYVCFFDGTYKNGATIIPINVWTHIAVVRSGTTLKYYINGVQDVNVFTSSGVITGGTGNIYIASTKDYITNGNIADLRIVNGTAVYTANFTPPTAPLTAITNTVLLTCQSNRFKDNSINNITSFTFSGTSSVSKFSPYAPTAYSKSIHGGSLSFNGTGTLSTPNSVANVTNLNFTVECWVNFSTNSIGYQPILGNTGTADYQGWICILESNNTLWFRSSDGGSWAWNISSGVVPSINNWHHIAVVRNGINLTMYLNGVSISTIATLGTSSIHSPTGAFYVGRYPFFPAGSRDFTGSMADVRVVKGTAVYTANFTPPTAPLTAITNTSLLLSGTNAGIVDNSMNSDLVTVGSAQVDTTIKKYGSSSMKFNGTTDYLLLPASPTNNLATGSWTLESWVNPTNYTNFNTIVAKRPSSPVPWSMFIKQTTGLLSFYTGTSIYYSSNAVALNSWSHVACVYSGTTLTMFINGVSVFSGTVTMGADVSSEVTIGAISAGVEYFTGNISDVRISKTARYTANFTPPTNSF